MTTQDAIRRAFKLMIILSILTTGGAFLYERKFLEKAVVTTGKIISFNKKPFSSAQGDSIEMEIQFTINGQQKKFYSGRNIIEQLMGTYKPGATIPVVYNTRGYPSTKIGYLQHLYSTTLIFLVLWALLFVGLAYAYKKSQRD